MSTVSVRRNATAAALAVLMVVSGFQLWSGGPNARAATGDTLASFDAAQTAGIPYCSSGIGTGIAFDGTSLLLSCWGSRVLQRVDPVTRTSNGPLTINGVSNLGAIAYDAGRDRLWACEGYTTVVAIDLNAQAVDPSIPSFGTYGCLDGLAYDGLTDTIWASHDAVMNIQHWGLDGSLLDNLSLSGTIGFCGNSGIAVGGENLYLANNGCSQIFQVSKDLSASEQLATFPRRIEDLECDGETFPGRGAIWAVDAYDWILNAWEIPAGLCEFGGGAVKPVLGGRGVVARITDSTTGASATAADSGELSTKDTASEENTAASWSTGLASGSALYARATTSAEDVTARAESGAEYLRFTVGGSVVEVSSLEATAFASCDGSSGTGRVGWLVVDGQPLGGDALSFPPNTTVDLGGFGTAVFNEQLAIEGGITVTAVHLTIGTVDLILGRATASATDC